MSVFQKLKGSFQNAQQDIVDGLRTLTSADNQSRHSILTREINLDVGAGLLLRFQTNWSLIQSETSKSAQKAEETSITMVPILKIWDKYAQTVTYLDQEARTISNIFATIEKLHTLLDVLHQDFLVVEKELDVLENVCDEQSFKSICLEEQKKLAMYTAKREAETERLNVDLANKHAKKMAVLESEKKVNLQERAEAFLSAFHDDINYYQKHGHPDLNRNKYSTVSRLSSIELDQNKEALDLFLGKDEPGHLELSGEGAYIEDDYITDYYVKQDTDFLETIDYTSAAVIRQMDIEDENYIYQENQQVSYIYEDNIHNPQNTTSLSKHLSDHRNNEDISEAIETTTDKVNEEDESQNGVKSKVSLEDSKVHDVLDVTNATVLITGTSTQYVNNTVIEDSGNDESAASHVTIV